MPAPRTSADHLAANLAQVSGQHHGFIRQLNSTVTYRPDGTVETTRDAAVWTLAHRGYSGGGRLDVWVYQTKAAALYAGADLAMECGLDEDPQAAALFAAGRYQQVLDRYEQTHPATHLLRVQAAFLQPCEHAEAIKHNRSQP